MKTVRIVLAAVLLAVVFVLSVYNAQLVRLNLFDHQSPPMPLFLVLGLFFFLGLLLAALFCAVRTARLQRQVARLERELEAARREAGRGASLP